MASIYSKYRKIINLPHLSGSALKVIAIISMVVDHCAYYLMENNTPNCRGFPVYPKQNEVLPAAAGIWRSQ